MRVKWLGLLVLMLCLGCISTDETRRKAAENSLNQLERDQLEEDQLERDQLERDQLERDQLERDQLEEEIEPRERYPHTPLSEFTHVIATETDYYTTAPQPSRPADGKFPAGTKVNIVEEGGGYVRVQSEGGVEVYVAASVIVKGENAALDIAGIVEGGNKFALDLYQQLRPQQGNLFFSPSSVSTALAMTYAGAAGVTETEMAKTLHFQLPKDRLHQAMLALQTDWKLPDEKKGIRLNLANRLWGQESYEFVPEFLDVTRDNYNAELARLNFGQPEQARQEINDWVEAQTEEIITDLIPKGVLDSDTLLVLTNAVYFKGSWSRQFKVGDTKNEEFHLTSSKRIAAPMMSRSGEYRYGESDGLQILELPYGDGSFSMVVLLPDAVDGLAGLEAKLTSQNLQHWIGSLKRRDVEVYLPKFTASSQFDLSDTLKTLGMNTAFDRYTADFSSMSIERNLFISAVAHKAFVDVNEEGTEAAAATGVVVQTILSLPISSMFRADHPFAFVIRDNRNGSILFLGRIVNPAE